MSENLDFLGLPGIKTTKKIETSETIEVEAEAVAPKFANCCLFQELRRDGSRSNRRLINDTPHGGKAVLIRLKVHRAKCLACEKKGIPEQFPQIQKSRHMTRRLFEMVSREGLNTNNSKIGRTIHVSEGTARSVLNEFITENIRKLKRETPRVLGLDEKMIVGEYRAVLGNIEKRTILELLPDRDWALHDYLENLPDKQNVEVFCTDMYPAYRQMWRRYLIHTAHVTDKFHVVRRADEALTDIRSAYTKTLEGRQRAELRGAKKIFMMRSNEIPDWASDKIKRWSLQHPILSEAYWAKERYYKLYEECKTPSEAEHYYRHWIKTLSPSIKAQFKKRCSITSHWMPTVLAYFEHPYTSGYIESLNRVIDDIQRAGRGYSFEVMRGKLLLSPPLEKKSFRSRTPNMMISGTNLPPEPGVNWGVDLHAIESALTSSFTLLKRVGDGYEATESEGFANIDMNLNIEAWWD